MSTMIWNRIRKEPLVHFLLLTALIFFAQWIFRGDEREVIVVDAATRDYLVKQEEDLRLRDLTDEDIDQLIDSYIEEEILFREALKRGYASSSRVRRLLVQNMRYFLASESREPTEEDLRQYYEENSDRFVSPEGRKIDNVYFVDPGKVPADTLERLQAGGVAGEVGDDTPYLERNLYDMTERRIATYFGPDGTHSIMGLDVGEWFGPIETPRGAHFIRVTEIIPPSRITFEQARDWLRGEWQLTQQRENTESALKEMSQSYRIVLPDENGTTDG